MGRAPERRPAGRCGAIAAITAPLTEPTSETIAPGLRCGAISARHRAVGADRHAKDDEIGARAPPPASVGDDLVAEPERLGASRAHRRIGVGRRRSSRATLRAAPRARSTSRSGRRPMIASRSKSGASSGAPRRVSSRRPPLMNSASAATTPSVRLFGADRQAQAIGQAVAGDRAQDEAARAQERRRPSFAVRPAVARKTQQQEIADARRHLDAEPGDLARPATAASARCAPTAVCDMRGVLERRDAGGDRRAVDVERRRAPGSARRRHAPAHRPSRCADWRGRRSSRTCASSRRSRMVETSSMPGGVVVARDIFGVGGVEHQQRRRPAGPRAAA